MAKVLLVVVSAVAVLSGCRHRLPERYVVPPTEAGNECKRTCMQVELACYGAKWSVEVCRARENECLATCPGVIIL